MRLNILMKSPFEKIFRPILLLFLVLATASCSHYQTTDSQGRTQAENPAGKKESQITIGQQIHSVDQLYTNPAVEALISQAKSYSQSGDDASAVSSLERALRISPKSAVLYYQLASVRLKQEQGALALQLAKKGQSFLPEELLNSDVNGQFWQLIGDAYTQLGEPRKAQQSYSRIP